MKIDLKKWQITTFYPYSAVLEPLDHLYSQTAQYPKSFVMSDVLGSARGAGSSREREIPHRRKDIIERTGRLEAVIRDHEAQLEIARQQMNSLRAQIASTLTETSQTWEKVVKTCYCAEVMNRLPVDTMGRLSERLKQCLQMKDEIEKENLAMKKNIERSRPMSESLAEEHRELLAENEQLQERLREGMSKSDRETIIRLNDELDRKEEELKEFESDYRERMEEKQLILQELQRELEALDKEDEQMKQAQAAESATSRAKRGAISPIKSAPQLRVIDDDAKSKRKKTVRKRRTKKPKEETPSVLLSTPQEEEEQKQSETSSTTTPPASTTSTSQSESSRESTSNEGSEASSESETASGESDTQTSSERESTESDED